MHAILDAGRGTLTLPRRLVPAVMLLGTRGRVGTDAAMLRDVVELERAGIAPDRQLHPLAARMLDVVTAPTRVITVEATRAGTTSISTIWIRSESAVLGMPAGGDLFQLGPVEIGLLPFHLAQLVGVTPRPELGFSGSVTAPAALLDGLADRWVDEPDRAVAALVAEGIDLHWSRRLAAVHRKPTTRWRIATLWLGSDGAPGDAEIMVIDAGADGYWQVLADADAVGQVTFVTRRLVDILELLQAVGAAQ